MKIISKDWILLEKRIAEITRGKIPTGSGNKSVKGDVRVSHNNIELYFECKFRSINKDFSVFTLPIDWFDTCETNCKTNILPILVFQPKILGNIYNPHFFIKEGDLSVFSAKKIFSKFKAKSSWCEISEEDIRSFFKQKESIQPIKKTIWQSKKLIINSTFRKSNEK